MRLTPPTIPVFLLAVLLAGLSGASRYAHIPTIGRYVVPHQYGLMVAAFLVLAVGVVFSGL